MRKALFTFAFTAIAAMAQIGTSTISGRVTDTSTAVVPNVKVTIVQKSTNFNYSATTNSDGLFRAVASARPVLGYV
ncbi:MAG: hypothetical protein JWN34_5353 [Bryobacterales bacterium]|nr:hypothetical protein [Bryobacterales bacterium]